MGLYQSRFSKQFLETLQSVQTTPLYGIFLHNLEIVEDDPSVGNEASFLDAEAGQRTYMCSDREQGQTFALVYRWPGSCEELGSLLFFDQLRQIVVF